MRVGPHQRATLSSKSDRRLSGIAHTRKRRTTASAQSANGGRHGHSVPCRTYVGSL